MIPASFISQILCASKRGLQTRFACARSSAPDVERHPPVHHAQLAKRKSRLREERKNPNSHNHLSPIHGDVYVESTMTRFEK
jgi:hypothetical protein